MIIGREGYPRKGKVVLGGKGRHHDSNKQKSKDGDGVQ